MHTVSENATAPVPPAAVKPIRSYTSSQGNGRVWAEFVRLFVRSVRSARNMEADVRGILRTVSKAEELVLRHAGMRVRNCKVLELGPGQLPRQLAYFAAHNDVVGIDLDIIPQGWNIWQYLGLLRRNGPKRFVKTVARKLMGYDRTFLRELSRQMGIERLPRPALLQMDATQMAFPPASFDFIYSFSVFEHLPDPAAVLKEMARVLKPGGCIYNHLHLYTCDDGGHDLRILGKHRGGMPYWPHLRPQHQDKVQAFAYINKLRLAEWKQIFSRELPGVQFAHDMDIGELPAALAELRAAGELPEYTDEELLTHNFIMVWQKPRE